ncbi:2-oxoglutarate receptor 1 [Amia ocellicauda]|uniref:2-oxoglutarate receptor 1 n=1 Tax=Amia ocellicauda TaxID=2972642 RepID=UPI003463DC83
MMGESLYVPKDDDLNCSNIDTLMKKYYLPVAYGIIFIVGVVGNIIAITIYVAKMRPWKSSSIIMLNLAIADLLYVLTLPIFVSYYGNSDSWTLGEFMCKFVRFAFHLNLYGSILLLTCLSIFRYIVVVHPLRAAKVQNKTWGMLACFIVWFILAMEIIPMLPMFRVIEKNETFTCLDFASNDPATIWWYGWLLTVLGYLVPLVIVSMCYISIVRVLASGPHMQSAYRVRARRITVVILLVFILCFLPYHILRTLRVDSQQRKVGCLYMKNIHAAYIISRPMAGMNTFFNLGLYTLAGDQFQQAFLSLFHCRRCFSHPKSSVNMAVIENTASSCR